MRPDPLTWVVGSGGLLGSAVWAATDPDRRWRPPRSVPWGTDGAASELASMTRAFLADAAGGPWQVAWCAGAGVTGSTDQARAAEAAVFDGFCSALGQSTSPSGGSLFLASSAGGVYAGQRGAPFDETTPTQPLAPYGRTKLALEERARLVHRTSGIPVLVGRISNLYGPGQNLGKAQGLISHVIRAHLLGQPISIYVPLDTLRDYLYVTDAARLVLDGLERVRVPGPDGGPGAVTKVLASQRAVTVGFLLGELGRVFKRRLRVVHGTSATAAFQARDLRLRSTVWPELDRTPVVPLPVGMRQTAQSLALALGAGRLR